MGENELEQATRRGPPPKLYKIGEVVDYTGLSRQTIHNYTMLGLIHSSGRTAAGHRLYGEQTFERLRKIALYRIHRSMTEIKELLDAEFGVPGAPEPTAKE